MVVRVAGSRWMKLASAVLVVALLGITACSSGTKRRLYPASGGPRVLTVPQVERMSQTGATPVAILAEIQRSGTVYRLTTQQERDLRAVGLPGDVIDQMELTYKHAVQRNPQLATSSSYWIQLDGYWYGGLPLGWPRDWVVGASAGQTLR